MLWFLSLGISLPLTGCGGQAWLPFENLQVGEPLGDLRDLPPEVIRDGLGLGYAQMVAEDTDLPRRATAIIMRALTDDAGKVVAKSYTYLSMAHQLAFLTGQYRYVLEMEVPAESFRDPTSRWQAEEELILLGRISSLAPGLLDRKVHVSSAKETTPEAAGPKGSV